MKRKLVKQGAATLMVSIPSKWAKANNLDKGDEVELDEFRNRLVLSVDGTSQRSERIIEINSLTESTIRTLITST